MRHLIKGILFLPVLLVVLLGTSVLKIDAAYEKDYLNIVYKNADKFGSSSLPYRLHVPDNYDPQNKYPLLVFLHGAGERGNDNDKQLSGTTNPPLRLVQKNFEGKYPCFILAPQCPADKRWVETDWGKGNYRIDNVPISVPARMLMDVIDQVCNQYNVDKSRLYITGLSMGGFGTWDLITRFPGKFAAAIPICGGGDPTKAGLIKDMPIRTFHGDKDNIVPVAGTREMAEALKNAGSTGFEYTEYPGVDHGAWPRAYATKDLYEWLFSQKLQPAPVKTENTKESAAEGRANPVTVYIIIGAAVIIAGTGVAYFSVRNKTSK